MNIACFIKKGFTINQKDNSLFHELSFLMMEPDYATFAAAAVIAALIVSTH